MTFAEDALPRILEIFADDVKASHGATVGQLDEEQLFYMKTRGFGDAAAKHLLVYSYCKEVLDKVNIPSLLKEITHCVMREYHGNTP